VRITLNGSEENLAASLTIAELVRAKNWQPERIVVEVNQEIIGRDSWSKVLLQEHDQVEILSFVGGGEN